MKIVCDNKIPYIAETLQQLADEVVFLPGARIGREDVADADALIVRTRTVCDAALLEGSAVRFVGTATIGFDHLDTRYLESRGIRWTNCPGCNAASVEQYVSACVDVLIKEGKIADPRTAGRKPKFAVLGHGHVGSRVASAAERRGFEVAVYDPFLFPDRPMEAVYDADVITFHVPMTTDGPHPTWHIADAGFFARLTRKPVVINSARGAVVDTPALIEALDSGKASGAVIDTWENEPDISLPLLRRCLIATPHIAGYSANGKVNADNMVVAALCRHFGLPLPEPILPPDVPYKPYNPMDDHHRLVADPGSFERLRGDYPVRLEKSLTPSPLSIRRGE